MSVNPSRGSPFGIARLALSDDKRGSRGMALSQTESTLARTNLSPFARCTLGLNRHSPAIYIKIFYTITACMTQGFISRKYWLMEEIVIFQKLDILRILTTNSVTTGARELNGTSAISLATHKPKILAEIEASYIHSKQQEKPKRPCWLFQISLFLVVP